jgi:hypothetical protein
MMIVAAVTAGILLAIAVGVAAVFNLFFSRSGPPKTAWNSVQSVNPLRLAACPLCQRSAIVIGDHFQES